MRSVRRYGTALPGFALLSAVTACPVPRRASRPVATRSASPSGSPAPTTAHPTAGDASALECQNDGDCVRGPPGEGFAFCEDHRCALHDALEAFTWARARVPAVRSLSPQGALFVSDVPWYTPGAHVVLYVRSDWLAKDLPKTRAPGPCVGVDFVAEEGVLRADIDDRSRPAARYGCFNDVELGATARLLRQCREPPDKPRGPDVESTEGEYCLGYGLSLSTANADGLFYGGVEFTGATPRCQWTSVDRPGCALASCRTCTIVLDVEASAACVDLDI